MLAKKNAGKTPQKNNKTTTTKPHCGGYIVNYMQLIASIIFSISPFVIN
jgi:hypothetical protein